MKTGSQDMNRMKGKPLIDTLTVLAEPLVSQSQTVPKRDVLLGWRLPGVLQSSLYENVLEFDR